jgi:hypothetical protein
MTALAILASLTSGINAAAAVVAAHQQDYGAMASFAICAFIFAVAALWVAE